MKNKYYTLLLFCLTTLFATATDPAVKPYQIGDVVKNFTLKNVNGNMVSLTDFKRFKGVMVIFTCNHCPFSQAYEDRIIALQRKYANEGFYLVAINPNDPKRQPEDSYENMQKRAIEKKYPFPYLFDETQETAKAFGATRTPHVFLLKKTKPGFELVYIGAIDDNYEDPKLVKEKYLENAITAVKTNKTIAPNTTKAIGCGIKWKK